MIKPTSTSASLAAIALSLGTLHATPIAGDSFRTGSGLCNPFYTVGNDNLGGQDVTAPGFQGAWLEAFGGSAAPNVLSSSLTYPGVPAAGGSLYYDTNGRSGRLLATPYTNATDATVYLSVRMQSPVAGGGYRGFELHNGGFDDGGNRVLQIVHGDLDGGVTPASNYKVQLFNTNFFFSDLGPDNGAVNLFVIRFDLDPTQSDQDAISVWRNPTDFVTEGNNTPDWTATGFDIQFDRTSFARFAGEDIAFDELRLGSAWADVVGPLDGDSDGMDDVWETVNMVSDPAGDALLDDDGLDNLAEFNNNTDPNNPDTDNDGIEDGAEVDGSGNPGSLTPPSPTCPTNPDTDGDTLDDLFEALANPFQTDAAKADTDGDDIPDATELALGSDPTDDQSTAVSPLSAQLIGLDFFDIVDGSIGGVVSGEGFDRDNSTERDTFIGHTATQSDWDGTANVVGGKLQTFNNNGAFREFNGPGEGGAVNSDEREGGYDIDLTFNDATEIYFKVEMTRQCDTTYAGLSLFNWDGGEELFYGVLGSNGEFGLEETGENNTDSLGTTPDDLTTYTIVGTVDIDGLTARFWLDPALGGAPPAADATLDLSISNFLNEANLSRLRLQSGGDGVTEWDNLVVGTTWASLSTAPTTSEDDPNLRDTWEAAWGITDGTANADSDSAINQAEHDGNTNPTQPDTDGDNLNDDVELAGTTNPRLADTDGDGLDDNVELSGSANTFNGAPTDPADCDSDGDGETDGFEISIGSNPNDPGSNSGTLGVIVIDGTREATYGSALAVQTVQTEFGDNLSEWNAAYATIKDGKLYLMLTGNLEDNFNKLEIFIDSSDAVTTNVLTTAGNDGSGVLNGLTFDTALTPDYHLIVRRGNDNGTQFDLDFADLGASTSSFYGNLFAGNGEGTGTTGTGVNASPIEVGFDNSNTAGVMGGTAAADQTAARAVTTGLELCIDLCDLGAPDDEDIRIMILQASNDHGFLSNQVLGGLEPPQGNLGGSPGTVDFSALTGDQFFSINVPAGSAVCGEDGITFTSIEQVGADIVLTWSTSGTVGAVDLYTSLDIQSGWTGPISANDADGTHTVVNPAADKAFYLAVPAGDPAP